MTEVMETLIHQEVDRPELTQEGEDWFKHRVPVFLGMANALPHEINNPLALVITNAQFLKGEVGKKEEIKEGEETTSILNSILKGAKRIAEVTKKLHFTVEFCQREGYRFRRTSPEELKHWLESEFKEGISIQGDFSTFSDEVLFDTPRLVAAFRELVKNSKEAGAKEITIEMDKKGDKLEIELTDDGEGINLRDGKMFDLCASTKVTEGGQARQFSIGLFIAKTIVLAHGGEIEIGNRKVTGEKGTIVRMTLPLADSGKV